ncbi:hypothetical protein KPL71_014282 [Citrus sinensis]|uniref:Uncharacterized protein n=1 Tax=Citrus sinensis TaxID=2711 RepID=A0ACB8KAI5_CITSI|nr:hypothetical protein KPL71_014282 [Citrus sinensis]
MATPKIDLEKFNGKNDFNMWKVKMEALLVTQGLGDAIQPVTKKEGKEFSTSKTPEQVSEIDRKARGTIILSLADSAIREVAKEPTIADLWAKLESIYMKKSLGNMLYIKKRMFTLKMVEGTSLDDHLDEFNKVCDTLETIDAAFDDEDKALLLISSLPKSYGNFVDALMYGRQTLSLDEVKLALNTKELQGKQDHLGNESGQGLTAKARPKGKKKKQGKYKEKPKDLKCFLCHKEGHFKKDYPEKKLKKKGQNGGAAVAEEEGYESAGVCIATDSKYKDYYDYNGSRVMMGNNVVCKIMGIGNVNLKLHDRTIRELRQVRLGHIGERGLKELEKQGVLGNDKLGNLDFCEDCVLGKATRTNFKRSVHKSKDKLEYVHSDLWGPAQQISLGENQTGKKLKKLRTDNGLEFCNQMFDNYYADEGIMRHRTVRLTPQQNGLAERMNMTLMERVRDVIFNEEELISKKSVQRKSEEDAKRSDTHQIEVELPNYYDTHEATDSGDINNESEAQDSTKPESQVQSYQLARDRAKRPTRPPKRYGYSKFRTEWKGVVDDEIMSLHNNETWELVERPEKRRIVGCKWIFKINEDMTSSEPKRFKARLVAKGYTQKEGVDFKEVFSPVVRHASIRVILSLTAVQDMELDQLDVKTAFLHGRLQEEIFMTQPKGVLHSFQILNSKPVVTPLVAHFRLSNLQSPKTSEEKLEIEDVPYANAVGCLMYAMVLTRPDISHAVSVVSRYMATPRKEHWKAVKWIMRYLSGTLSCGLVYGKNKGSCEGLLGFVDSDYAGDLDKRRSLTCYMFLFNGCLINWKATLQHVVALSTTEAEYTAATEVVKEALCLQGNPAHHERTKHIDIKLHFIRNEVSKGVVKMSKVHTDENPVDMLTKVIEEFWFEAVTTSACDLLKFKTTGAGDVLAKGLSEACEMHVVEEPNIEELLLITLRSALKIVDQEGYHFKILAIDEYADMSTMTRGSLTGKLMVYEISVAIVQLMCSMAVGWDAVDVQLGRQPQLPVFLKVIGCVRG